MQTTIGISVPLSVNSKDDADVRSVGRDVAHAIELSQKALGSDYRLLVVDNNNTSAGALYAIECFVKEKAMAVLGLPTSDEVHRSASALAAANLIAISSMATSPHLLTYSHIFRTRSSDNCAGEILSKFIQEQGYKQIGLVSEDTAYAKDLCKLLASKLQGSGTNFKHVVCETHKRNVSHAVEQLPEESDAVFIGSQDEEGFLRLLRAVRKRYGELDTAVQVIACAMPGSRHFLDIAGNAADNIIYVSEPSIAKTTTSYGNDFISHFEESYGLPETGNYAVALTYASFLALHTAINSGSELHQALSSMVFNSKVNGSFRFEKNEITNSFLSSEENRFAEHTLKIIRKGMSVDYGRVG